MAPSGASPRRRDGVAVADTSIVAATRLRGVLTTSSRHREQLSTTCCARLRAAEQTTIREVGMSDVRLEPAAVVVDGDLRVEAGTITTEAVFSPVIDAQRGRFLHEVSATRSRRRCSSFVATAQKRWAHPDPERSTARSAAQPPCADALHRGIPDHDSTPIARRVREAVSTPEDAQVCRRRTVMRIVGHDRDVVDSCSTAST